MDIRAAAALAANSSPALRRFVPTRFWLNDGVAARYAFGRQGNPANKRAPADCPSREGAWRSSTGRGFRLCGPNVAWATKVPVAGGRSEQAEVWCARMKLLRLY
jgi:hypothetical protein